MQTENAEQTSSDRFVALNAVDLDVRAGEVLGIIGKNGAGKSTLLKLLSRVTAPSTGTIRIRGRVASLLEVGTGFHPELTGRENVFLNGAILGMKRTEVSAKFDQIVAFSGVERFIDTPVKRYSSGMYVRLAFAVAAHLEPDILIIDEVLAVGDFEFQKKCLGKIGEVSREGRTVIFVSHNMASINNLTTRCALLAGGRLVDEGEPADITRRYMAQGASMGNAANWSADATAPGGRELRLSRVAIDKLVKTASPDFDVSDTLVVRIGVEVLEEGVEPSFWVHLYDEGDAPVFTSANLESDVAVGESQAAARLEKGSYTVTCRIPAYLLNKGTYTISVFSYAARNLYHRLARADRVVGFSVTDSRPVVGTMNYAGSVHPRLIWNTVREGA